MNENNMNQTQNTQNGYSQAQQPYPQSSYPQSGYPQSGFPQSGYPQSGYPQSGMPYPMSGYEEKKTSTGKIVIISIVAVLIVALAIALVVILQGEKDPVVIPGNNTSQTINGGLMSAPPGSVLLNGEPVAFEVIKENGKTSLPVKELAEAIDFDCVINGDKIQIVSPAEIVTLEVGSTKVEFADQIAGGTTSVNITTEPFKKGDDVYVYSRDIAFFIKNATVSYNPHLDVVEISVEGMNPAQAGGQVPPGGAPPQDGQLPPADQLPPGGAPPQGVQPPQGGQVPPGGAPPQGVQPPQN